MLPKREPEGGNSPVPSAATAGVFGRRPGIVSQTPDRSGLPSTVRGAGAVVFTLPSGVLGTPGGEYFGHCASTADDKAKMTPGPIPEIREEADIYRALGLDYVEPELREGGPEFAAAEEHRLPRLIDRDT